jgi:rifampicin phosphotransferase
MTPVVGSSRDANPTAPGEAPRPAVVRLGEPASLDPAQVGAKAANLARSRAAGLPTLPGAVVTTTAMRAGPLTESTYDALRAAWEALGGPDRPMVVRSSSTVEDTSTSSMAGQFTSVLDVRSWDRLRDAVSAVIASAARPHDATTAAQPMAVLVQPLLDAACGGVLFGVDPVTGDRTHLVAEAVAGVPDALVSGAVTATHAVMTRRGRLVGGSSGDVRTLLPLGRRRRLAALARETTAALGGPQDVEFAFDERDRLWMLQSRAITAAATGDAAGPVLGAGPLAEMFPEPLHALEVDLWIDPLRQAVVGALHTVGIHRPRRVARSPVVAVVGGRPAVDLELFGVAPQRRAWLDALSPARGLRRLLAAWRTGRLEHALPVLATDLLDHADAELCDLGALEELTDHELLELLDRASAELVALHGHEVLAGMLLAADPTRPSLDGLALAAAERGKADGLTDEELCCRYPVALALVPPAIGPSPRLGQVVGPGRRGLGPPEVAGLGDREALRLRCRWVQELGARTAEELGRRLRAAGVLDDAGSVRDLRLAELRDAVRGAPAPLSVEPPELMAAPLPASFRLTSRSEPVAVSGRRRRGQEGLGASAGRVVGTVVQDPGQADQVADPVLVVDALDPRLAVALPGLVGLVSETGSALSHLAILARERRVPAVAAVADARARFPSGARVLLDGATGEVRLLGGGEPR